MSGCLLDFAGGSLHGIVVDAGKNFTKPFAVKDFGLLFGWQ